MRRHSGTSEKILSMAVVALGEIEERGIALDEFLDGNSTAVAHLEQRRALSSLLFSFFRKKRLWEKLLAQCTSRPVDAELRRIILLGAHMARFQNAVAEASAVNIAVDYAKKRRRSWAGFANAVLHQLLRNVPEKLSVVELLPQEAQRRWSGAFPLETVVKLAELYQEEADFSFRTSANCDKATLPEGCVETALEFDCDWQFFTGSGAALLQSEAFRNGTVYIQDPAPAWVMMLTREMAMPPQTILDLCAAPGGKALMLSERFPDATMTACDRSEKRLKLLMENLLRCKRQMETLCVDASQNDSALAGRSFDLVLCDVPCSNSGVFRKRSDALHRLCDNTIREIVPLQRAILQGAAAFVAPGGYLLYSTCSLEAEENFGQIAEFLQDHPEFSRVKEALLMPEKAHDGTFGALLRRGANEQE